MLSGKQKIEELKKIQQQTAKGFKPVRIGNAIIQAASGETTFSGLDPILAGATTNDTIFPVVESAQNYKMAFSELLKVMNLKVLSLDWDIFNDNTLTLTSDQLNYSRIYLNLIGDYGNLAPPTIFNLTLDSNWPQDYVKIHIKNRTNFTGSQSRAIFKININLGATFLQTFYFGQIDPDQNQQQNSVLAIAAKTEFEIINGEFRNPYGMVGTSVYTGAETIFEGSTPAIILPNIMYRYKFFTNRPSTTDGGEAGSDLWYYVDTDGTEDLGNLDQRLCKYANNVVLGDTHPDHGVIYGGLSDRQVITGILTYTSSNYAESFEQTTGLIGVSESTRFGSSLGLVFANKPIKLYQNGNGQQTAYLAGEWQ